MLTCDVFVCAKDGIYVVLTYIQILRGMIGYISVWLWNINFINFQANPILDNKSKSKELLKEGRNETI
jgi:hypothetical protein